MVKKRDYGRCGPSVGIDKLVLIISGIVRYADTTSRRIIAMITLMLHTVTKKEIDCAVSLRSRGARNSRYDLEI